MSLPWHRVGLAFLSVLALHPIVRAEDAGEVEAYDGDEYANYNQGDDYIKYWTGYAMYPKKCITYKGVDMIVFSAFRNGFKQCSDAPMGTYITPVPTFVQAYLDQMYANEVDMGNDGYAKPESAIYAQCSQYNLNDGQYSVMIGCDDSDPHKLAVNVYSDATCDTRSYVDGMDDANIDISELQIPFHSCQACVTWLDKNDDEVDDQYYENKQIDAPLCSQVWATKMKCDKSCQKLGKEYEDSAHWDHADIVLLGVLGMFAAVMMVGVVKKRRQMRVKEESLLSSEVPIKLPEPPLFSDNSLLIAFGVCLALIVLFAIFVLKHLTWIFVLGLNLVLFGYLLKLVMDSGTTCGNGADDDDSDDEEEEEPPTPAVASGEMT